MTLVNAFAVKSDKVENLANNFEIWKVIHTYYEQNQSDYKEQDNKRDILVCSGLATYDQCDRGCSLLCLKMDTEQVWTAQRVNTGTHTLTIEECCDCPKTSWWHFWGTKLVAKSCRILSARECQRMHSFPKECSIRLSRLWQSDSASFYFPW